MSVLVAAPVALLAQGYNTIFLDDIDSDTLQGAFNIPIEVPHPNKINYALNKYDLVAVDEASMISSRIFQTMASTFNRLNKRPVVVLAGDECKQQPLETNDGRITSTTSIINDHTFSSCNAVIHTLYQQFRVIDPEYAKLLDLIRITLSTQQQVDELQRQSCALKDNSPMKTSVRRISSTATPPSWPSLARVCSKSTTSSFAIYSWDGPFVTSLLPPSPTWTPSFLTNKCVIFTENRDKAARKTGNRQQARQQATIVGCENNTIILSLPEGQVFVYPVTHMDNDVQITCYPFTPAYAQTIIKSQARNICHLIIWLDSDVVPPGTGYVGLSRVRTRSSISLLQPIHAHQLRPVKL